MPQEYHALSPEHKALIDSVAASNPEKLPGFMRVCMIIGDYETCTYVTAKHFDKLPLAVQTELRVSGLKTISDITQDLVDGVVGSNPEAKEFAQKAAGFDSIHIDTSGSMH